MPDSKGSSMVNTTQSTSTSQHSTFLMVQNILRILAIVLLAASIAVMVTNNQTVSIFSIRLEAHFYYSTSLKFLVAANGVVCIMSVLTLMIVNYLLRQQAPQQKVYHYFFLFVHDMVMTLLLMAGCAAATAIGYVGQYGEQHMGWLPMCDHVRKFCKTNLVSLLLSYLAFFAYLGLTILTVHRSISFSPKKINQMDHHDDPQAL
ncbi:CASP-like protein 1F2 [Lotus japonicus]|uniref:CASP-like protein 1F2 n=1 Tax=Lotus japonicus TaxID=34305 RepID=UPI002588EB4F|nr:CASP-like protein 1F2 [Lotus japonicus]